jgi:hypothetical protein
MLSGTAFQENPNDSDNGSRSLPPSRTYHRSNMSWMSTCPEILQEKALADGLKLSNTLL